MPTPAQTLALGQTIVALRLERGLSQEQLALRSGLDRSHLGRIERGEKNPRLETVFTIVEGLEVSLVEFFARYEDVLRRRRERR